jgi:hypothetical protein
MYVYDEQRNVLEAVNTFVDVNVLVWHGRNGFHAQVETDKVAH